MGFFYKKNPILHSDSRTELQLSYAIICNRFELALIQ